MSHLHVILLLVASLVGVGRAAPAGFQDLWQGRQNSEHQTNFLFDVKGQQAGKPTKDEIYNPEDFLDIIGKALERLDDSNGANKVGDVFRVFAAYLRRVDESSRYIAPLFDKAADIIDKNIGPVD